MTPPTLRGGRKLSELARHLIVPDGIVSTAWPSVEVQLRRMQLPLDQWQQGFCQAVLGKREGGQYACGIGGAVASIPRQSGKTHTVGALVFALCLAQPGMLALWTAHRTRTHNETFKSLDGLSQRKNVAPFVQNVRKANGEQEIEFVNGSRILFGAREQGFGRGFAKVDVLVLDEAQILTERAMEDMVPATNAAPNGLVLMVGTPPRPNVDPGDVFTARRTDAISGDDRDVLYVEFSADPDADVDDRAQWEKANPSYPFRTTETAVLRMRKLLGSDDSFRREALGIWDAARRSAVFGEGAWEAGLRDRRPDGLEVGALGVAVSIDGAWSAVVAGARDDSDAWVKPLHHGPGMGWIVDSCRELQAETGAEVVIDGRGPGAVLIPLLEREGVRVRTAATGDVLNACAEFEQLVREGRLLYEEAPELDAAVAGAKKRAVGDRWAWGRKDSEDISPLEAATLAAWAADAPAGGVSVYEGGRGVMTV